MRSLTFYGKIKGGVLLLDHKATFQECVSTIKDCDVEIIIGKAQENTTHLQWKYLYGCVYTPFGEHFGWTIDEVDVWVKRKFMKDNGIELPKGLTLTKTVFDREWLAKFIDSAIMYCAEEGLSVLPPNPDWKTCKGQT
ncbi:hypothetical protein LCGC14_2664080 [marine sediment metagenome]|uniref:Uncharacterized protein n=1 Tax=marine sediment metagenome TaxID=412755 RepID=A0A0F8ZR21_9ZZZZ